MLEKGKSCSVLGDRYPLQGWIMRVGRSCRCRHLTLEKEQTLRNILAAFQFGFGSSILCISQLLPHLLVIFKAGLTLSQWCKWQLAKVHYTVRSVGTSRLRSFALTGWGFQWLRHTLGSPATQDSLCWRHLGLNWGHYTCEDCALSLSFSSCKRPCREHESEESSGTWYQGWSRWLSSQNFSAL